jgi:hypothetical protein
MTLPGPNQTGTADRRPRMLPAERLSMPRPARLRTMAQAIAAGLKLDEASREAGYADGAAGKTWDPGGTFEVLAYSSGFLDGQRFGRDNKGG